MTCCINTFLFLEDFNANVFFSFKSCSNFISAPFILSLLTEAVSRRCSLKHLCWSLLFNKVVVGWKVFLKISQNSQETPTLKSFFNEFTSLQQTTQVCSYKFYEIFKNTLVHTKPPVDASVLLERLLKLQVFF